MSGEYDSMRIYICGAHSTGKTTLLNDIRAHLDANIQVAMEVARGIIREHGWTREDFLPSLYPDVFLQLNREILQKQISMENKYFVDKIDFVSDRGIDPLIYAQMYVSEEAKQSLYQTPGISAWLNRMKQSLVLLISPHKECFRDDSVRLPPNLEELQAFTVAMETELMHNNIPFHKIIMLDRDERVAAALNALKEFKQKKYNCNLENDKGH